MREFWDKDIRYSLCRKYVDFCTRRCFRRTEIRGTLPHWEEGSWLVTSNHTSTLMDALVTLPLQKGPFSFGARADVFRNPRIARFLHFCKMLPLARKNRDSEAEMARNVSTLQEIDRVLEHHVPFGIYPEGRHRPMHSLLPFHRGIASMAFRSAAQRPTYILPIGLDYSDWFHFRSHLRITLGEPLDVNAFAAALPEGIDDSTRDHALQDELFRRTSALIFYLPDDETSPQRLALAESARKKPSLSLRLLLGTLTFPFFALSALLTLPLWALAEGICARLKDHAWNNTVRFGIKLVGTPLWGLMLAALLFALLPWWAAALLLLYYLPSYSLFYDWLNLVNGRTLPPL